MPPTGKVLFDAMLELIALVLSFVVNAVARHSGLIILNDFASDTVPARLSEKGGSVFFDNIRSPLGYSRGPADTLKQIIIVPALRSRNGQLGKDSKPVVAGRTFFEPGTGAIKSAGDL